jgi:hypothetical protein
MLQYRFNAASALQCSFNAACFSVASMLLQRCLNTMSTPLQCRFNAALIPLRNRLSASLLLRRWFNAATDKHIPNIKKPLEIQGMYNVTTHGALGTVFLHGFVALIFWLEAALLLRCACVLAFAVFSRAYVVTSCFSDFRHEFVSRLSLGEALVDFD